MDKFNAQVDCFATDIHQRRLAVIYCPLSLDPAGQLRGLQNRHAAQPDSLLHLPGRVGHRAPDGRLLHRGQRIAGGGHQRHLRRDHDRGPRAQ